MLRLPTDILQPGMVLAHSIIDEQGRTLLRQGVTLTGDYIALLKRRGFRSAEVYDSDASELLSDSSLIDETRAQAQRALAQLFGFIQAVAQEINETTPQATSAALADPGLTNALQTNPAFDRLETTVAAMLEASLTTDTLIRLNQLRTMHHSQLEHGVNVAMAGLALGKQLHLSEDDLKRLGVGCLLHDIGKTFIKPAPTGPPSTEALGREHTRLGYELLRAHNPEAVMSNHVALEHHERQDGRGFPRGLYGTNSVERTRFDRKNILLISEIVAIADIYDILNTPTAGGLTLSPSQVAATMRRLAGTYLNQALVQIFLAMLPVLPTGMNVVVLTERYRRYKGVVVHANPALPERPVIRLLFNAQGERIAPIDLNLASKPAITVEAIL